MHFEGDLGDGVPEPGPMGRFIIRAQLDNERRVLVERRDFEELDPALGSGQYWFPADELSSEWDPALHTYWRLIKVRETWEWRRERLKAAGLIQD